MFDSQSLEAFTVISAPAFLVLWASLLPAILAAGVVYAPTPWAALFVALGVLVWTAVEYGLHRYAFHFEARSRLLQRIVFVIHGNHHAEPNDPLRNLMPPIVSVPLGALIWVTMVAVGGAQATWCFLGFMLGYVGYDLVHYACHQRPMKGRWARALKVHHMRHHHLRAAGNYAVTGVFWDWLLSTRIARRAEP